MRKTSASLTLVFLLPALLSAQSKPSPAQKPLAFTHVTVIEATGAPPKPDMTVLIAGGRIVAIDSTDFFGDDSNSARRFSNSLPV